MVRIKPRFSTPGVSKYVIRDQKTGDVCYRVPPACVKWPQPFRLRIIKDMMTGTSLSKSAAESYIRYMTISPFTVQKTGVQLFVKLLPVDGNSSRVMIENYLLADGRKEAMHLYHANPAVRSLMVYAYLTHEHIGGMPKLRLTEDYQ